MIQQLLTFNKGLSTKLDPHLIGRDEAVICDNIDINDGSLHPLKDFILDGTTTGKYTTYYNGNIIANTDPTDERFYVEYAGHLYWSNATFGSYGLMRYDGTSAGVEAAAPNPLTSTEAGYISIAEDTNPGRLSPSATYVYAFTIVDTDGIESAPFIHTTEVTTTGNKNSMKLSISHADMTTIGTNHPDMAYMNFYRTGGNNPTFNLVADNMIPTHPDVIDTGTHYEWYDVMADIDVPRIELVTIDDYPPHQDLDMLIENLGTFWGAVGNKVYYSRTGRPEYWHPLDYVVLDGECTGIGKFADSIYAFTEYAAYRIDGYNRDTVVRTKLPYNQGCVHKDCITNIDTYLVWTSKNGICIFNGAEITVVTKNKLLWESFDLVGEQTFDEFDTKKWNSGDGFEITYSLGYKDKYFGITNTGMLVVDLSEGLKITTMSFTGAESLFYNNIDNVLMVVSGTDLYGYALSNDYMTATYKTGRLADEGTTITKHYRDVELDGMPISIEVFVNGVSKCYHEGRNKFKLPPGSFGRDIQFKVVTNEEIRSIKYEYSIKKA